MATANEELLSAAIRHQVQLLRFSKGEARRAVKLLEEGEKQLTTMIEAGLTEFSQARVNGLLKDVTRLRSALMDRLGGQLTGSLEKLADVEAKWEKTALEAVIPVDLKLRSVPPETVKALAKTRIQGIPLEGWLENMKAADIRRLEQTINLGVLEGLTPAQLSRRVLDQGLATTKRNAEALARTAVNNVSNAAREEVWKANSDIITGLRWTSTLDGRTTEVCMARDGEVYPIGKGPRAPAHFNCRSLMVAVLDGETIVGDRPFVRDTRTRRVREIDFRKEAKKAAGDKWKSMTPGQRNDAIKAIRSKWAAENIGRVPAKTTYDSWLRGQSKEFQNEILGKGKADIFRKGFPLNQFVDANGKSLSLAELQARAAQDGLFVAQPGVGLKAKALLQQGLAPADVLAAIQKEFPDATTSLGSIASYKSELKKLGLMDELLGKVPTTGPAPSLQALLDSFDGSLSPGLKHALGGQWANVVDDLVGSPGAYGAYTAGKGVQLSAKKLATVSAAQAQQVIAHELGHLLHKQHGLKPMTTPNQMKALANTKMTPEGRKIAAYYLATPDELVAEIIAQALSPSPLTSQGLSATEFRLIFASQIESVKNQSITKFPIPAKAAPKPVMGAPTMPFEVAGKHTTVGGLSKALLQQGMPDEMVLAAVKAEFPNAKTGLNSIKSYKSELKKQGLLKTPGQGPTVAATKPSMTTPPPLKAETVFAFKPKVSDPIGPVPLPPKSSYKLEAQKLFASGVLDNNEVVKLLNEKFILPPGMKAPNYANVATWKTQWKKATPAGAASAEATAAKAAKKATETGPPPPKLHGQSLGPYASKALEEAKAFYANGGTAAQALEQVAKKHFGFTATMDKFQDLWDLAVYQVQTAKAAGKPYVNAAFADAKPKADWAKAPYIIQSTAKSIANGPLFQKGYKAFQEAKAMGYGPIKIGKYMEQQTGTKWAKAWKTKFEDLYLYEKTHGVLTPPAGGGYSSSSSSFSSASASSVDMTPKRPAAHPRDGLPPPPRFTAEQRAAGIKKYHRMDTGGMESTNVMQRKLGLPELTPEEYSAVRGYTSNVAFELNSKLRNGLYAQDMHLQAFVEAAQEGLRKMPKHNPAEILSRGVSPSNMQAFMSTYHVGAVVNEASFISTSYGGRAAFDRNVIFKIKHKNGVKIDQFSHYQSEREVLLMPGTRIRVLKVERNVQGKAAIIHIEEID